MIAMYHLPTTLLCVCVCQIRNLEVRLARYTNGGQSHEGACARWRGQGYSEECSYISSNSRRDGPLPVVEEALSACEADDGVNPPAPAFAGHYSTIALASPNPPLEAGTPQAYSGSPGDINNVASACGVRLKKIEGQFRRNCEVLGANAVRVSGNAAAAASKAAVGAAREAVQLVTVAGAGAAAGFREARMNGQGEGGSWETERHRDDSRKDSNCRVETDKAANDEYWGSDYCTQA